MRTAINALLEDANHASRALLCGPAGRAWAPLALACLASACLVGVVVNALAALVTALSFVPGLALTAYMSLHEAETRAGRNVAREERSRNMIVAGLALCSALACTGHALSFFLGGGAGAIIALVGVCAAILLIASWFAGSNRELALVVAPQAICLAVFFGFSLVRAEAAILAPAAGAAILAITLTVAATRARISEGERLVSDRVRLIDELFRAERENREASERLELALQISGSCAWELRPRAQRLIRGETARGVLGRAISWNTLPVALSLLHPDDVRKVLRAYLQAMRGPMSGKIDCRFFKESQLRWLVVRFKSLRNNEGQIDRIIVMMIDITERKQAEAALSQTFERAESALRAKRDLIASIDAELCGYADGAVQFAAPLQTPLAKDNLEGMAGQLQAFMKDFSARDAALFEAVGALRAARAAADAANTAKSQFLANMSHELRTPLNAVIGYSEIILEDLQEDVARDDIAADVRRVRAAGEHLLRLINSVLDLSKIEAGQVDLEIAPVDLAVLAAEIIETVRPTADKKGLELRLEIDRPAPSLRSDATKLRQCLLNLMSNACKFTAEGAVTLRIAQAPGDPAHVVFEVQDTGIGLSQQQLLRVFEPFVQADSSITRKFGGTGLGLAITRRFARLLGGDVSAESAPGEGARFILTIAAEADAVAPALEALTEGGGPLALIIDDDPMHVDLVRRALQKVEMRLSVAATGAQGLATAKAVNPDLILLDVNLPDMSGWDVMTQLRDDPDLAQTPILLVSVEEARARALAAGAADHLVKPVSASVLAAAALRLARRPDAEIAAPAPDAPQTFEQLRQRLEAAKRA